MATQREGSELWVLIAAVFASSMAFIDGTALNVALPTLQRDLNMNGAQLLWVVNAYMLFLAALILVGGSLGDHYGRKRVFMWGVVLFTGASILCGIAQSAEFMIGARALKGVGGALMVPGSLAIISASIPLERRGRAIGLWSMFSTSVTIFGPVLGGWLASQGLWRWVFFINVPLAGMVLAALLRVPETRDSRAARQLDYPGAVLATLGLAGLTYGFTEAPGQGFANPLILFTLIGGALALILFVIVEARSPHPMVPLGLFRQRTFAGTNLLTLFLYAALGAALFFFPLNLIQVQGYRDDLAGLAIIPFAGLLGLIAPFSGRLVDRFGARLPLTVGPALTGIGFAMVALPGLTSGAPDYWTAYFPAMLVLGIGMGITVAPLTTAVMTSAPDENAGTASGINNAVARTAGVLAVAILGSVVLLQFSSSLGSRTSALGLDPTAQATLMEQASRLAEAQPPANLSADLAAQVETAIQLAFIDAFRVVQLIAAGLAFISAAVAFVMIESKGTPRAQAQPAAAPLSGD
jgi:EmrB/QacA subfamily drug resistance transporter